MLRAFNDTTNVADSRWTPSPVHEDWHAVCRAICKGVDGEEWEKLCHKYVEIG